MFEHKIPLFNPAPLRREILESVRDLALLEQSARYGDYSDGVLAGCGLFEHDMNVGVTGGLIKFGGRVYVLPDKAGVPYRPTDTWTVLKIQFGGEEKGRDFLRFVGHMTLDENTNILPNELELGRFKLKRGSRLRTEYADFADMETEYDTVNLIHVPYAGIGEATLSPTVLMHFAREAYPIVTEPADVAFCCACLAGNGVMSRESIVRYLSRHSESEIGPQTNHSLHRRLAQILAGLKGSGPDASGRQENKGVLLL
jgi:hypothetical protein